ncbi:ABC transporter permease [Niallia sp.]|uniref:ABC transporter permease n=1 Tax=Niallia sp. TaxID=2837523 RepID=UPI00289994CE|nr:ABC transporter permease [Niallia sp.]
MKSSQLFYNRVIQNWRFQSQVFRSVVDWTVVLYILIPAIIFCAAIYLSWWKELPGWIDNIPFIIPFFVLYLLSWTGNIRTFMAEADKVFLVKMPDLIRGLKRRAYLYSFLHQILVMCAGISCLLPFLLHYYLLNWQEIIILFVYFSTLQACLLFLKYQIRKVVSTFRKSIIILCLFLVFNWFSQWMYSIVDNGYHFPVYAISIAILILSIILSLKAISKIGSLDLHIEMEQERKSSITQYIFMASLQIEKPVVISRKKPLIFRNSKRIFKKRTPINGLIELFIKIVVRNSSYLYGYFMLINSTTWAVILVPPIWIKIVIFIGFCFMMYGWLIALWNKVCQYNSLMNKYMDRDFYFSARKRGAWIILVLAVLVIILFYIVVWLLKAIIGIV